MFRISWILFVLLFLLVNQGMSQIQIPERTVSFSVEYLTVSSNDIWRKKSELFYYHDYNYPDIRDPELLKWKSNVPPGFFCEIEYKINEATGIPFTFRLGSLSYVNKLEGKEIYEALPFPYLQKAGLRKRQ